MGEPRQVKSVCRICIGTCGVVLTLDDQRIVSVRGDKHHPLSQGYACIKGLSAGDAAASADRILRPLKRRPDGGFDEISLDQALGEIAEILRGVIAEDGPDSIALFKGTQGYLNTSLAPMMEAWLAAIGSRSFFTTMTIDQSAKFVSWQRLGQWGAGLHHFHDSDVMLLAGTSPLVSLSVMGMIAYNMTKQFKDARARGVKFIVVDPRASETARFADVHLQIIPGQDPTLFAGLIREILVNDWHDAAFCAAHAGQLAELRREVEPFTLEMVAERVGVRAEDVAAAARLFAFESKKGCAVSGTGPNMAPRSNLAQHLIDTLNVICGRFRRAGDTVRNPGVLNPQDQLRAEVVPPTRAWMSGPKSRVRGIGGMFGEMMSGTLPEEILTPGKGRIRVLFVNGGNPAVALPDQRKTVDAFKALDLLVTVEPFMTPTARLSHYILPPKLMFEREDVLMNVGYEPLFMPVPHQAFVPAAVEPPPGSELVDEWKVYWELARRLGYTVSLSGRALDMDHAPSTREIIDIVISSGVTTVAELEASPGGKMFDRPPAIVGEGRDDPTLRFELMPDDVAQEMRQVAARPSVTAQAYPLLLTSRRMREVMNSLGNNWAGPRERHTYNPAYLHPDELASHDLSPGDRVEIASDHDSIEAIVAADGSLRRGVVSMSHCWGGLPDEPSDYEQIGSCTARLVSLDRDVEPINAMPRMTAIPVRIRLSSPSGRRWPEGPDEGLSATKAAASGKAPL